jgi:hypothetical protein
MDALTTKTQGSVVRADLELPNSVAQTVSGTSLFYEATL